MSDDDDDDDLQAMFPAPPSNHGTATPYHVLKYHAVEGIGRTRYLLQDNNENLWHGECKRPIEDFAPFLSLDDNKCTRPIWLKDQSLDGEHMHLMRRELLYPKYDEKTMTRFRGNSTADDVYIKRQRVLKDYAFTHADEERAPLPKAHLLREIEVCELLSRTTEKPHPNIARYLGVVTGQNNDVTALVYQRYTVNLTEFRAASLFHANNAFPILEDIGKALNRFHQLGYKHCRVMPENVLLSFDSGKADAFRLAASSRSVLGQSKDPKGKVPAPPELKIDAVVFGDLSATMKIAACPKGREHLDNLDSFYEWMVKPDAKGNVSPVGCRFGCCGIVG